MGTEAQQLLSSEPPRQFEPGLSIHGLKPVAELGKTKPHGTRLRYMSGCKCLQCRMANSNYETTRARARAAGDWNGVISATEARAHIKKLSHRGVGYKLVADSAGVSRTGQLGVMLGKRTKSLQIRKDRITARTAADVAELYRKLTA